MELNQKQRKIIIFGALGMLLLPIIILIFIKFPLLFIIAIIGAGAALMQRLEK